jgi:putative membrane protein
MTVLTVACDARDRTDRYDDSTATITDNESTADRDDLGEPSTVGTSGQAARDATGAAGFAEKAMEANKAEVQLGELAQQKAHNAEVKEFARMMVRDHTNALNELKQAVAGRGTVEEPSKLDAKHQSLHDRLSKLNGAEFDREYMKAMVDGHRDVKNMLDERADQKPAAATGTSGRTADGSQLDSAVNQWASQTLPAVEQHLQKAEQITDRLK